MAFPKKHILFLLTIQFGHHTDTYMYCKYLDKSRYKVSYFCFDMQLPKMDLPDTEVFYVNLHKNKLVRYYVFIKQFNRLIRSQKYDLIFHVHTKYTFLLRLFNLHKPIVLDIRTGDLNENNIIRSFKNQGIKLLTFLYPNVSVVSESLARTMAISNKKTTIIPLGGEFQDIPSKDFATLRLLYIGTIDNRNVHESIYGLYEFLQLYPQFSISYDIIGSGKVYWQNILNKAIAETNLNKVVHYHGWKGKSEIIPFLKKCNIGVVYIPQRVYYECQPSTKFYEFLLAGMPVIATNTFENRISLKKNCGVLTEDNPSSFSNAIEQIVINSHLFKSERIKYLYTDSSWPKIVDSILTPYLDKCIEG